MLRLTKGNDLSENLHDFGQELAELKHPAHQRFYINLAAVKLSGPSEAVSPKYPRPSLHEDVVVSRGKTCYEVPI